VLSIAEQKRGARGERDRDDVVNYRKLEKLVDSECGAELAGTGMRRVTEGTFEKSITSRFTAGSAFRKRSATVLRVILLSWSSR
jgi:hypothetical protein